MLKTFAIGTLAALTIAGAASHASTVNAQTKDIVDTAVAAGGKLFPGDRRYVQLTLKPDTYERARQNGIRTTSGGTGVVNG